MDFDRQGAILRDGILDANQLNVVLDDFEDDGNNWHVSVYVIPCHLLGQNDIAMQHCALHNIEWRSLPKIVNAKSVSFTSMRGPTTY